MFKGKGRGKGEKRATPPPPSSSSAVVSDGERPVQPAPELEQEGTQEEGYRRARTKRSCRLRDEQQESEVLEWVEENPLLWNSKHREFKLRPKRDRLWAEKAEELGYDGKLLYYHFNIFLGIFCILSF